VKRLVLISILIGLLDQATKVIANLVIPLGAPDKELIPFMWNGEQFHLITFTHVHNKGIAFGMMQGVESATQFFTFSSVIMGIVILIAMRYLHKKEPGICFALALQLGGAIGNVIDRIRLKYVLDFIQLPNWPVFNVADISVTIGTVLLIYYLVRPRPADETAQIAPEMSEGVMEHVGFSLPENPTIEDAGNNHGERQPETTEAPVPELTASEPVKPEDPSAV